MKSMTNTDHQTAGHTADQVATDHDDFGGLAADAPSLVGRRRALAWIGGIGLAGMLASCASGGDAAGSSTTGGATDDAVGAATDPSTNTPANTPAGSVASATDAVADTMAATDATVVGGTPIPEETGGPFPADGSNGPDVLTEAGVVRADIRSSIGDFTGTADGIPTTIQLTIVDAATGAALPGTAVYAWHCTADGKYSIYEVEDQNYLRGVQATDANGRVAFTTVFPGCYRGRWPHVHFEVFESLDAATASDTPMRTSQLALPEAESSAVYADDRYADSASNLARQELNSDNVFADGWQDQLATVSGSNGDGYTVSLLVRV